MIKPEKEYNTIVERVETLLQDPNNIENKDAKGYIELNILSDKIIEFEKKMYSLN
jgi:HTH-type transcriptional regulator/antitoxin HigA